MNTELLTIEAREYHPECLQPAVDVLRQQGLVAFPTETVYGLGASVDAPEAVARLRELKGRPDAPFTLHIATLQQLEDHAPGRSELANRLIERFWPGPLTLVLPTPDGGSIGLRYPAARMACDLITQAGPLWAPSANPAGESPALTPEGVLAYFDGQVELILAHEPQTLSGQASTVVRLDGDRLTTLREGAIPQAQLDRMTRRLILFVCSGNTCRSPLAEALMTVRLASRLGVAAEALAEHGVIVESAGTMAGHGAPPAEHSVTLAAEAGHDLSAHRSQGITIDLMLEADLILTLTRGHAQVLASMLPQIQDRLFPLGVGGRDIADPVGGDLEIYRRAAREIEAGVDAAIERFGLA